MSRVRAAADSREEWKSPQTSAKSPQDWGGRSLGAGLFLSNTGFLQKWSVFDLNLNPANNLLNQIKK